jgi:hypothetical protein
MHIAYVVIALTTAIVTGGIAVADFIPAGLGLANSAEIGVPRSWLPALGAAKLAGAVGLVAGLWVSGPWESRPRSVWSYSSSTRC